ncbi:MAG TPA: CAP domain-containing protein [Solirubrobacteraceae bacterium]|nr:CAP domain-containing protein [Solirubrobacteraceae bacterium]
MAAAAIAIALSTGLLAVDAFVPSAAASVSACPGAEVPYEPGREQQMRAALLCLTNNERVARGLQPLATAPALEVAAQRHAADTIARNYLSHTAPSPAPFGQEPRDRAAAAGYPNGHGNVSASWTVGETIFAGTEDATQLYARPRAAIEAWMASAGHCRAILSPEFRHLGAGIERNPRPGASPESPASIWYHWVLLLGVVGDQSSPGHGCPASAGLLPPAPSASPAPRSPSADLAPASGTSAASSPEMFAAKLRLQRARIRGGRLDLLVRITRRATGPVDVSYRSASTTTRFAAPINNGTIRIDRRLPSSQSRKTTGIVTLTYPGNGRLRRDQLRLRVASGKALLKRGTTRIDDSGRLRVSGTISKRARGAVRIRLEYTARESGVRFLSSRAEIDDGTWSLTKALPIDAANAGGHLSIQYTGYQARRIRGEQLAKAVTP